MDDSIPPAPDIPSSSRETVNPASRPLVADLAEVEFAACYQAEMPSLIGYLIKYGASYHDAIEAAQEALIELHKQWHGVTKHRAWLRTVAIRKYLNFPVNQTGPWREDNDRPGGLSASSRIEFREEEQAVIAAFRQLPVTQRAVLALHYDQFETRDIAEILEISEPAVRKNLERGRATLKRLLGLA
jgi:RNA polymerase sigma factor (sigma-70 family)